MLSLLRKHATSWLIKVALFAIVIVFIFWGGYSYQARKASRLAKVDDHYITYAEYNQAYDQLLQNYRKRFGEQFNEDLIKRLNLKQQAMDMLVDRYLIMKAAQDLGLVATDWEVQQQIVQYPVFQKDGRFDHDRYVLVLQHNHFTPEQFEQQLLEDLTIKKVEKFIREQALVTPQEVDTYLQFYLSEIRLVLVSFNPNRFKKNIEVNDKELRSYYKKNLDRYMEPEKRQLAWVSFPIDDYLDQVKVTDDQIAAYYEEHKEEFHHPKEVRARHILFRVAKDAPKKEIEKVKKEAEKVLEKARQGADFAELAKKYSQGPSAKKGGDLGYFTRDRMVPAFADAAFSLKVGQISDLVRTSFGFHIIKVEDIKPEETTPLDKARKDIELKLKRERAKDIAYQHAEDFADQAFAQGDVVKAAEAAKLKYQAPETWFNQRSPLPGIGNIPQVMGKLFQLSAKEVSGVLDFPKGYLVGQVRGIRPVQASPFDKVKKRVENDLKMQKAGEVAKKAATKLLEAAVKLGDLKKVAAAEKIPVKESEWFSRKNPPKGLPLWGDTQEAVFRLKLNKPFPDKPLQSGNLFLVCQLIGKRAPSAEVLKKNRDEITATLLRQKKQMLWQSWLKQRREQSQVEILQKL